MNGSSIQPNSSLLVIKMHVKLTATELYYKIQDKIYIVAKVMLHAIVHLLVNLANRIDMELREYDYSV